MMRWLRRLFKLGILFVVLGLLGVGVVYLYFSPSLPDAHTLRNITYQVPLRVMSQDEKLIAEFGEMHRTPLPLEAVPQPFIDAILATEDHRFYQHNGVDFLGLLRAAVNLVQSGNKEQGGSTITMQVARNFFLTRQKTYTRKLNEIILAFKIEGQLSKDEILNLYVNKIYLGHRAYGIAAAAQVYYGAPVNELTLAQFATIAGLPKAPSALNPISHPTRARDRRQHVLNRMYRLGYIDEEQYNIASDAPITAHYHSPSSELEASYVAEMVRQDLFEQFGQSIYTDGLTVYTTLDSQQQAAANLALRHAVMAYEERHGYRGPEGHIELPALIDEVEELDETAESEGRAIIDDAHDVDIEVEALKTHVLLENQAGPPFPEEEVTEHADEPEKEAYAEALRTLGAEYRSIGGLRPALVTHVHEKSIEAQFADEIAFTIDWDDLAWAKKQLGHLRFGYLPKEASDIVSRGDVIRVYRIDASRWRLAQLPEAEGAFVAMQPQTGAITALVGGFSYNHSKFNRVTQAQRQAGSAFKPFIYSAALENGLTPATIINDAPVVYDDPTLTDQWRPRNDNRNFMGPTRLREGLMRSRNLVTIRVLRSIGIANAINHISQFGFDEDKIPHGLSIALGSAEITPLQSVTGFSVFANGGYRVLPYYIARIEDSKGKVLFTADPLQVCDARHTPDAEQADDAVCRPAPQVISSQNAYLMNSMLRDVIKHGTGRRALVLNRDDLAGKTGTTSNFHDAWFSGFNVDLAAATWVGFDEPRSLGEYGSQAALPMWIEFMRTALTNQPEKTLPRPSGLVTVRIDPETGLLAAPGQSDAIFETFFEGNAPREMAQSRSNNMSSDALSATHVNDEAPVADLF